MQKPWHFVANPYTVCYTLVSERIPFSGCIDGRHLSYQECQDIVSKRPDD